MGSGISVIFPQTKLPEWSGPVDDALWTVENVDGDPFKINGSAFTAGVSGNQIMYVDATPGISTNIPALAGKTVNGVLRGGIGCGKIITIAATGSRVQWDMANTNLIVASGNDWIGEELTIFYTN